jgi:hypothetical protein
MTRTVPYEVNFTLQGLRYIQQSNHKENVKYFLRETDLK